MLAPAVVDAHRCGVRVRSGGGQELRTASSSSGRPPDLPHGIEAVALVSGDGDFVPLVWQQQMRGHQVFVVSRKQALSRHLAAEADWVWYLDDLELVA